MVWVVELIIPYRGFEVEDVFNSKEDAVKYVNKYKNDRIGINYAIIPKYADQFS